VLFKNPPACFFFFLSFLLDTLMSGFFNYAYTFMFGESKETVQQKERLKYENNISTAIAELEASIAELNVQLRAHVSAGKAATSAENKKLCFAASMRVQKEISTKKQQLETLHHLLSEYRQQQANKKFVDIITQAAAALPQPGTADALDPLMVDVSGALDESAKIQKIISAPLGTAPQSTLAGSELMNSDIWDQFDVSEPALPAVITPSTTATAAAAATTLSVTVPPSRPLQQTDDSGTTTVTLQITAEQARAFTHQADMERKPPADLLQVQPRTTAVRDRRQRVAQ
jgi:type II secretory pathway pseudopilin PulG